MRAYQNLGFGKALFGLAILTGCGGSNDASVAQFSPYDAFDEELQTMTAAAIGNIASDPALLPAGGSVAYDGIISFEIDQGASASIGVAGDLRVTALFDSNDMTGTVTGMIGSNDQAFPGTLTVESAFIDRATNLVDDFTIDAELEGTFTGPNNQSYTSDMFIVGDFLGAGQEFIEGEVRGSVQNNGDDLDVDGNFIAQQE